MKFKVFVCDQCLPSLITDENKLTIKRTAERQFTSKIYLFCSIVPLGIILK